MTYPYKVLLITLFISVAVPNAFAHPGGTDGNSGHTCRTNCPSWGYSYGEYHYHGGSAPAVAGVTKVIPAPTAVPKPQPVQSISKVVVAKPSAAINNANIPVVVARVFQSVYGRAIRPSESTYWKGRARTDKKTESGLRGAMQFHKDRGVNH